MDSRQKAAAMLIAMAAVCCIVGVTTYELTHSSGSGDDVISDEDYLGCWYLVQTVRNNGDGTIMDIRVGDEDDAQLADRSINIFSVEDGLVHATYGGEGITGYVERDQIHIYYPSHGNFTSFTGYLKDGFIVTVNAHSDLDGDGKAFAACAGLNIYSKNPARPTMDVSGIFPDISGDWHLSSEMASSSSAPVTLVGLDLSIDWMKDGVFSGTITPHWQEGTRTIGVKGSMIPCNEGYRGMMADDRYGTNWSITLRDGEIRMGSTDSRLIGGASGAVELGLTRDGTGHKAETPQVELLGTTWIATSSKEVDIHGNRSSGGNVYVLSFDEQNEDIVHGKSVYGTRDANAYFYFVFDMGDGRSGMLASWDEFHDTATIGYGWHIDGKMHVIECYVDDDGAPITRITILELYVPASEGEILGHWYACYATGYDQYGEYAETTYQNDPSLGLYDIDILTYGDGLIFGRFFGSNITAGYSNGFINTDIIQQEGNYIHTARGWFEGSIMVLVTGFTVSNGDGTYSSSAYYVAYSKVREAISINLPTTDMSGAWPSESHTEYLIDGRLVELGETTMKIDEVRRNSLIGTLGTANVKGVYFDAAEGLIMGIVTDDAGMQWYFTGNDSVVYMNRISSNLYGDEMAGDECIKFTRGGPQPDVEVPDLSGKVYEAVELKFIYDDGERRTVDYRNVMEITGQQGNCVIGKWQVNETVFDITGSMFWMGDTLVVRLSFQNGPSEYTTPLGYLTIKDDITMASIHHSEDVRHATGSSLMTEVTL